MGQLRKATYVLVEWLHSYRSKGCTLHAIYKVASNGGLQMLEWLHSNCIKGCTTNNAMDVAEAGGHLAVVERLHTYRSQRPWMVQQ